MNKSRNNNMDSDMFSIGAHCCVEYCRQLDYLPFICKCKKIICKEHRYNHDCTAQIKNSSSVKTEMSSMVSTLCESCKQYVRDASLMTKHLESGCKNYTLIRLQKANCCAKNGCKSRLLLPIICKNCDQSYCIRHRAPEDHTCDNNTMDISVY